MITGEQETSKEIFNQREVTMPTVILIYNVWVSHTSLFNQFNQLFKHSSSFILFKDVLFLSQNRRLASTSQCYNFRC